MRILLVEDEKLELETLRDYVDWKKLGIEKVYTARNGRSALECMAEHEPDIMITDIQMPVMNGIELTQRVRGEGYQCKIIFLTGYDDFEYVKAAFSVNAVDYILKPFGVEDVENLIRRVSAQILKERMAADSLRMASGKLLEQACTLEIEKKRLDALSEMHFGRPASEASFGMLAVYGYTLGQDEAALLEQPEVMHLFKTPLFLFMILRGHVRTQDAALRMGRFFGERGCVVWSKDKISLLNLHAKAVCIEMLKDTLFYHMPGGLLCLEEAPVFQAGTVRPEALHEKRGRLREAIAAAEAEEARAALADCLSELSVCGREECRREAYGVYLNLHNRLVMEDAQLLEYMQNAQGNMEPALMDTAFFEEIGRNLLDYTWRLCGFFRKQKEDPNYYVIGWVKEYVSKNYAGICSVESMAEGLHLSPNYLRSLFKTGTGQTILEYLTDYRLEKACALLKDKTLKVHEISSRTGYENVSWFSRLFVKKYGVTPNEYRKMV